MKSSDIVRIENVAKEGYTIRWNVTKFCNYQCDFCIQGNRKKHIEDSKGESIEKREIICKKIINIIESELDSKYDYLNIYLVGGEVTILPDFLEIVEKIVNCKFHGKIKITVTSNLSTPINVLKKINKIFMNKKNRKIRINASYYKEFTNEDEFIDKIRVLNKNNKYIKNKIIRLIYRKIFYKSINENVRVGVGYPLCTDSDYDKYLEFQKKLKKYFVEASVIIIKNYKTSISTDLKRKIVDDNNLRKNIKVTFENGEIFYCTNNNKITLKIDEDGFNPNGYLCDSGLYSISIDNLGNVARCTTCRKETFIGNIITDNIKLPAEKFICSSNKCGCSYYSVIEKVN